MNKKEYGGFFEFPATSKTVLKESAYQYLVNHDGNEKITPIFVGDGRQAIKLVLQRNLSTLKPMKILLPTFLCKSIIQPFDELGLEFSFYDLEDPLIPVLNFDMKNQCIFIIDYFGIESVSNEKIIDLANNGCFVIIDISHSLLKTKRFEIAHPYVSLVGSLRKLFPIPDGGVLYHLNTGKSSKEALKRSLGYIPMLQAMFLKKFYTEQENPNDLQQIKGEYLNLYSQYEEIKEETKIIIHELPDISREILNGLDIRNLVKTRFDNVQFLQKHIQSEYLLFNKDQTPSYIILKFKNELLREISRKEFIKNQIYTPIHWILSGYVPKDYNYAHILSKSILTLPFDQRYSIEDIKSIFVDFPSIFQ